MLCVHKTYMIHSVHLVRDNKRTFHKLIPTISLKDQTIFTNTSQMLILFDFLINLTFYGIF